MRRAARVSAFQAGVLALTLLVVGVYFGATKSNPFTQSFELKAMFANASNIQLGSPVRIAGVEVGKVSKVEGAKGDAEATLVTMKLKDDALPLHRDTRVKIRPRIFLEGNFFVDIRPGTPAAPKLREGDTIPVSQTAAPVQIDQVLGALKTTSRQDLQKLLQGYGDALGGKPAPGEDDDQDPSVQGKTAAQALNDSLGNSAEALRGTAVAGEALLGTQLHDLSKLIAGGQKVSAALSTHEAQLQDLITNFNTTTGALAARATDLRATIRVLPGTLGAARSALDNLNSAFPPTRAFAREILPGLRETPATIEASFPWIAQTRQLVSPAELQGLVRDLQPSINDLAQVIDDTSKLVPEVNLTDRCALEVLLPTAEKKISDGAFTTGIANYKELFQTLVGFSGESQNFDGNGSYTRFQTGGGSRTLSTQELPSSPKQFGNASRPPLGTRPALPAAKPPQRSGRACYRNKLPDLDSAKTGSGP